MENPSRRLLLVTNDDAALESCGGALEGKAEIVVARELSHAGELLREQPFDVILLDLFLPDEQGMDLFVRIFAQVPHVPILILTATADEDLARHAVHSGARGFLVKRRATAAEILSAVDAATGEQRPVGDESPTIDVETGLFDRAGFLRMAEQYLRLGAGAGKNLLLVASEIEGLSEICRDFGADAEGRIIADAAAILRLTFRASDLLARTGPDRFIALAMVNPRDEGAEILAARFRELLDAHQARNRRPWNLSLSFVSRSLDPEGLVTAEEFLLFAEGMVRKLR